MIISVLFLVLISQSSASFFSEITGALGSVKAKVGKLISDVGHDLKETVDCATYVVEEVIYDKDQISSYYDKCKETTTEFASNDPGTEAPAISIIIKPIGTVVEATTKTTIVFVKENHDDIGEKLSNVESVVNDEFMNVSKVTSHLENEFINLSDNVEEKLKLIEQEKADLQIALFEIKNLHLQEELEIESTKDEIRKIFEQILNKMNKSTNESDLRTEMNAAMADLEKNSGKIIMEEIEKWKDKGVEQLKYLKKYEENNNNEATTKSNIPRTFKELAQKLSQQTVQPDTVVTTTYNVNNIVSPAVSSSFLSEIEDSTVVMSTRVTNNETIIQPEIINISTNQPITTTVSDKIITLNKYLVSSAAESTMPPLLANTETLYNDHDNSQSGKEDTDQLMTTIILKKPPLPKDFNSSESAKNNAFISTTFPASDTMPTISTLMLDRIMTTTVKPIATTIISSEANKDNLPVIHEVDQIIATTIKPKQSSTTIENSVDKPLIDTNTIPTTSLPTTPKTYSSSAIEPIFESSNFTLTTPKYVSPDLSTTTPSTLEQMSSSSSVSKLPTTTMNPIKTINKPGNTTKHHKKSNRKKRPLTHLQVHQLLTESGETLPSPKPSSDVADLVPKNPKAAAAEALKIFGGSIKNKSLLDNFFKKLDATPVIKS